MQTILLLLCKDHISLYESENFSRRYVNGDESVHFRRSQLHEDLRRLIADLCNEANADSEDDFTFILLENEDPLLNESVKKCLKVRESIPVNLLLEETIKDLSKAADLMLKDYGVNFDGKCYRISPKGTESSSFSLFAYTVHDDDLMASCKNAIQAFAVKHKISL